MTGKNRRKRVLLRCLIASVGLGALLGIVAVLRGNWSWFEIRVILTTMTIAAASLLGVACDFTQTPRGMNLLPRSGLVLTSVSALMILLGVWDALDSEFYWKSTIVLSVFCVATVHASLISIAQLAKRFRWVGWLTKQVIFGLALMIAGVVLFEIAEDGIIRFIIVLAIVDAALNMMIPLLHRLSKTDQHGERISTAIELRNTAAIDDEIELLKQKIEKLERLKIELQSE